MRMRVQNLAIFEKVRCKCGGGQRLKILKKNYLYFLYIFTIKIFLKNTLVWPWFTKQRKKKARKQNKTQNKNENTKQNTKEVTNI